ncbi:MAG: SPFH domain-containing protein [Desulfotomaculales bacterium]
MFLTIFFLVILFVLVASSVRIVQEFERGVIFRLGRFVGVRGPGLFLLIPFIERMQKVDLRVVTMDVPAQEAITRDNVTVKVNAVVYFRVVNPGDAVIKVLDHVKATSQLSQTTLRSVLGQSELDELLAHREQINQRLQRIIDEGTEPWGVKVSLVEIRDVELPQSMQRAMAAQAEAERERRAKIIHADGEYQAAEKLAEAARIIAAEPAALQLRYLQTLREMATDKANTIIFPLPIDLVKPFLEMLGRRSSAAGGAGQA